MLVMRRSRPERLVKPRAGRQTRGVKSARLLARLPPSDGLAKAITAMKPMKDESHEGNERYESHESHESHEGHEGYEEHEDHEGQATGSAKTIHKHTYVTYVFATTPFQKKTYKRKPILLDCPEHTNVFCFEKNNSF